MTSQILVPQAISAKVQPADASPSNSRITVAGNGAIPSERCASELQHLQAETAALLQQLQSLKQQRLASTQADS